MNVDSNGLLIYAAFVVAALVIAFFYVPRLWRATQPGTFMVLWFAIVAAFAGYGLCGPGLAYQYVDGPFSLRTALEPTVLYGAHGFCVASSVVVGLIVTIGVRSHGAQRSIAISILLGSWVVSTIGPPLLMAFSGLYRGEGGLLILYEAVFAGIVAAVLFLVLTVCVLSIPQR